MAKNVDDLRAKLAKAQQDEDTARAAFKASERKTKAAARELLSALAGDLDLSAAERKALGLRKAVGR